MPHVQLLNLEQVKRFLQKPTTFATVLLAIIIDEFGVEAFDWDPTVLRTEVFDTYGVEMPEANSDKLQALMLSLSSNLCYRSLETFFHTCNALSALGPEEGISMEVMDPPNAEEVCWGVAEILLNEPSGPQENLRERFSHDVRRYMGVALKEEGMFAAPKILADLVEWDEDPMVEADRRLSDDPTMFASLHKRSADDTADLDMATRLRLESLLRQLEVLPLQEGGTRRTVEQLRARIAPRAKSHMM